ncbi:GTP cyclohydrolase II [Helicobacter sp. 13S00482-2]|uniref:GTP cyclohydrolase II n=1 Tax=Helicobacter sp. 13S00482-2 TaxID=1476200 RepID=UPI000BA654D6|nr:GTP cyclohydrolase II [Helicobacter sp. 13S00482-2]PAF53517.1 GTP cyclohydrolase II [Helicobacter sp. 13S00482-2]
MEKFQVSQKAKLPTRFGNFFIQSFREFKLEKECECPVEHLVVFTDKFCDAPLVRVHSECLTGDVFGSHKCDCGGELALAMEKIAQEQENGKGGMLIYLRQEGRGIGLFNKVNAYALQDKGYDTVEANEALGFKSDNRNYSLVGDIFEYYKIKKIRLLTNNPKKIEAMSKYVEVSRDSIVVPSNCYNEKYLATKKAKLGHLL